MVRTNGSQLVRISSSGSPPAAAPHGTRKVLHAAYVASNTAQNSRPPPRFSRRRHTCVEASSANHFLAEVADPPSSAITVINPPSRLGTYNPFRAEQRTSSQLNVP